MTIKKSRSSLFRHLNGVLTRAEKKALNKKTKNGDKLSWNRLIIQAINAYGKLLETEDLESMRRDIDKIKEKIKIDK